MNQVDTQLNTIEEAIQDIRAGKVIIVVDDEDRENEGDFICAAEKVTPDIINFMAKHGRGLICTPILEDKARELNLNMMVSDNTALHETAFTVSIDLIGQGCTTGISAYDRATGIKAMIDPDISAADFARPGHIFPLIAKNGGVLRRTGHTEASVDLAKLAGFYPAGVLVEILNDDGSMARLPELMVIAEHFDLKIVSIKDLVEYRMRTERLIKREKTIHIESEFGSLEIIPFLQITTGDIHFVIKKGEWVEGEPVLTRVHSSTGSADLIGLLFGSHSEVLKKSLRMIADEGKGMLLYMRQSEEKYSILNTFNKLDKKTINSENTHEIISQNPMKQRDFGVGAQILHDMNVKKIKLITNTPRKRVGIMGYGLEIVDNVALS